MRGAAELLDQLFGYVRLHSELAVLQPDFAPVVLWPYWESLLSLNLGTLKEWVKDTTYREGVEAAYCWWLAEPPEWWGLILRPRLTVREPRPRCLEVEFHYHLGPHGFSCKIDAMRGGFT